MDCIVNTISKHRQMKFNLTIPDGDTLPHFGCSGDISRSINHRTYNNTDIYFCILYDEAHVSPILDIKQFLNARALCPICVCSFHHIEGYHKHRCQTCVEITDKAPKKISQIELTRDVMSFLRAGASSEQLDKRNNKVIKYIIWDIESRQDNDDDGLVGHRPNLVVALAIIVTHTDVSFAYNTNEDMTLIEDYVDALEPVVSNGDKCIEEYVDFVVTDELNIKRRHNTPKPYDQTICIAHNSSGYDSRFIETYLDKKSYQCEPIKDNSWRLLKLSIKGCNISWFDSFNFFLAQLANLPKTFSINNSMNGHFPHGFNTYDNHNYIGPLPDIEYVHPEYITIINGKGKVDFSEHAELIQWYEREKEKYEISGRQYNLQK